MKYLVVSKNGEGAGTAFRYAEEGSESRLFLGDPIVQRKHDGISDKVKTIKEGLDWEPDYVVIDSNYFGKESDWIIEGGWPTIGGTTETEKLEENRRYGIEIMKKYGINIPPTFFPKTIDEARKIINDPKFKSWGWCIKPDGDAPKDQTKASKDAEVILQMLDKWEREKFKYTFILQKFIEGVEIDTEIYISKGRIVNVCKGLFESKKFANDNDGPPTGCSSSISWGYRNPRPPIFMATLAKMASYFKEHNYTGLFSINCIVSKDGRIWGIEFNPRFGYSDSYATMNILPMDYSKFTSDMIDGTIKPWQWRPGFGAALCLSIPPYPLDTSEKKDDALIRQIYDRFAKDVPVKMELKSKDYMPLDLYIKDDELRCAGTGDGICEIMAYASTLDKLGEELFKKKDKVKVDSKHTRTDIIDDFKRREKKLIAAGYNLSGFTDKTFSNLRPPNEI